MMLDFLKNTIADVTGVTKALQKNRLLMRFLSICNAVTSVTLKIYIRMRGARSLMNSSE